MRKFLLSNWIWMLAILLGEFAAIGFAQQPNCYTSSSTAWQTFQLVVQTKDFTTNVFGVMPTTTPAVGSGGPVVAMSQSALSGTTGNLYPQNFTLMRQSESGYWDLFNGQTGSYTHDAGCAIQWAQGRTDSFYFQVSITNQTATLYITPNIPGQAACAIGTNYMFRSTAGKITSVGFWNLDQTTMPLTVCNFGVAVPSPQVNGVLPTAGAIGTQVNVTGSGFGATQGSSSLSFGGVPATTISAWSATSISATVPNAATTGPVIVSINNQISNQNVTFTVTAGPNPNPPQIVSVQSTLTLALACSQQAAQPVSHQVVLAWNASTSAGVTGYNVYRSSVSGASYQKIGATTNAVLTYTDPNLTGATSGTTFYYVVTALANGLESIYSNQVSATIP